MLNQAIAKINDAIKKYKNHSNEWSVGNQLIDILAVQKDSVEIVMQDFEIQEMNVEALIKKVVGKSLTNPVEVMQAICNFYKIPVPSTLPPEQWRTSTLQLSKQPSKPKASDDFFALLGGI